MKYPKAHKIIRTFDYVEKACTDVDYLKKKFKAEQKRIERKQAEKAAQSTKVRPIRKTA